MTNRIYLFAVLTLWMASTFWLVSAKVAPTLLNGEPPDFGDLLPKQAAELPPVCWSIRWNDRKIGWASNQVARRIDGTGLVESTVEFEDLPWKDLLSDVFGAFPGFMKPSFVDTDATPLDLRIHSKLRFDHYGALRHFMTTLDLGAEIRFLRIEGHVNGKTLELTARSQVLTGTDGQLYRNVVQLPPNGLIADTFSPRPQLGRLRVGQTWIFQSYRPLMPRNSLELMEAKVEREETIDWNGQLAKTFLVAYRRDAGSGLSATREPVGKVWVRRDGTVLRQEVSLAHLSVQFVRLPDGECHRADHP